MHSWYSVPAKKMLKQEVVDETQEASTECLSAGLFVALEEPWGPPSPAWVSVSFL